MLKDDIVVETKRTVVVTSASKHYGGSKGKMGWDDRDIRGKCDSRDSRHTSHHNEAGESGEQAVENPSQDRSIEQTRFMFPPSQLLLIIQSLQGFRMA